MSLESDLFTVFDKPTCSKTSQLYDLERDLRDFSRRLESGTEYQGVSGLVVKAEGDPHKLITARRYLRAMADGLAKQLNDRFNEEAERRPAPVLKIRWPAGADYLDHQDGTAKVRGTFVLLGTRRVAYLGEEMTSFHLCAGFSLRAEGDTYIVEENPPQYCIENGRIIFRYLKRHWGKGAAWDHLRRKFNVTRDNNPWRKNHGSPYWSWSARLSDLPDGVLANETIQAQEA